MDQYAYRPTPPHQNTPQGYHQPRLYPYNGASYEGYMTLYDSARHMDDQRRYQRRKRCQASRELESLRIEVADLKRILAHQSKLLREKDSLLFQKDAEINNFREAIAEAKIEIDRAIKLKISLKCKKKMIAELISLRDTLAAENAQLKSDMDEMSRDLEQPPKPPPIDLGEINGWDPADVEFLKTFDFGATKYYPDKPVYKVRKMNGIRDNWKVSRMCLNFTNGHCNIGLACKYGHSTKELTPLRISNWKMVPCTRTSCRGISCIFRHGEMRRQLWSDFYLVFGGLIDKPRLAFYPSASISEDEFKKYLHLMLDRLERVLPKRLLPAQVVIPYGVFEWMFTFRLINHAPTSQDS